MKKFFVFLLFVFVAFNGFCEKKPLIDKILDYQCSLQLDDLSGNVKDMTHYRQNMINGKIDSLRLYRKTRYNKNEKLVYEEEYFSKYGAKQFDNSYTFTYDDFNRPIKKVSVVPFYKEAYFETNYKYIDESNRIEQYAIEDYSGKKRNANKFVNYDRIEIAVLDSLQNPIVDKRIEKNDTTITTSKYIYNSFGNYTAVFRTYKTKSGVDKYDEEDAYDENQKTTKQVFNDDNKVNYVRELEYDKKSQIKTIKETMSDSSVIVTRFNDKALPIEKQSYKKGILQSDDSYQYKFDDKNNWIEKKVLSQDFSKGEKEAKLTSIETRVITYFE